MNITLYKCEWDNLRHLEQKSIPDPVKDYLRLALPRTCTIRLIHLASAYVTKSHLMIRDYIHDNDLCHVIFLAT